MWLRLPGYDLGYDLARPAYLQFRFHDPWQETCNIAIPLCEPPVPTPPSECGFAGMATDHPPSPRRAKSQSAWQPSPPCCPLAAGFWYKVPRGAPRAHTSPERPCGTNWGIHPPTVGSPPINM